MKTTITLAFSSCPNDTFIFDALVHKRIDTEGLNFNYHIEDVETLNKAAFNQEYDITKLSFHAFFHLLPSYICLKSGSALCDNFGPVLISKNEIVKHDFSNLTVAVPGLNTSAALIFKHFFKAKSLIPFLFSEIEQAVLTGKADMGIIIHENVFTFKDLGLTEIANLGTMWSHSYNLPVPLGCIAVKRTFPTEIQQKVNRLIRKSIEYAFDNPQTSYNFVKQNAVNLSDEIIKKHIETYVNSYSLELNNNAKKAIELLYVGMVKQGLIQTSDLPLFVEK